MTTDNASKIFFLKPIVMVKFDSRQVASFHSQRQEDFLKVIARVESACETVLKQTLSWPLKKPDTWADHDTKDIPRYAQNKHRNLAVIFSENCGRGRLGSSSSLLYFNYNKYQNNSE